MFKKEKKKWLKADCLDEYETRTVGKTAENRKN